MGGWVEVDQGRENGDICNNVNNKNNVTPPQKKEKKYSDLGLWHKMVAVAR